MGDRRRFLLRTTNTFQKLHDAIQTACGWLDYHLFAFHDSEQAKLDSDRAR